MSNLARFFLAFCLGAVILLILYGCGVGGDSQTDQQSPDELKTIMPVNSSTCQESKTCV